MVWEGNCGHCWVWCVRSSVSVEAAVPTWPGAGAADDRVDDGVFSNPALFLSGDTGGFIRLWDRRSSGPCAAAARGHLGRIDSSILAEGDENGMEAGAIAGLALNSATSFFTTGFDGILRETSNPLRALSPFVLYLLLPNAPVSHTRRFVSDRCLGFAHNARPLCDGGSPDDGATRQPPRARHTCGA